MDFRIAFRAIAVVRNSCYRHDDGGGANLVEGNGQLG